MFYDQSKGVGVSANSCLARRVKNNHIMASSGCELVTLFLSSARVSRRLHSRILALGFIRFGGCFGWRRFRCSRLRRDSAAALLFCSASVAWLIGEMNQWNYVSHANRAAARKSSSFTLSFLLLFSVWVFCSCAASFAADRSSWPRSLFLFTGWHANILPRSRHLTARGAISLTRK